MRALLLLLIATYAFSQTTPPTNGQLKAKGYVAPENTTATRNPGPTVKGPAPEVIAEGKSDWWVTAFTGVLAGAAIIQLFLYLKQTQYMRDSLAATARAANAAALGASVAELALKLGQRADVLLKAASIVNLDGRTGEGVAHDTRVMLEFKNFGPTRAEDVVFEITLEIPTAPVGRKSLGPAIIGPGDTQNVPFGVFGDHLTEQTAIDINSGKIPMRFRGKVSYKDVFGERHNATCGGEFDPRTRRFRVDGSNV